MIERIKIINVIDVGLEKEVNEYIKNHVTEYEKVIDIKLFKNKNELEPTTAVLYIGIL